MNRQQSYTGTPVARRASLPAQYPRQRGEVPDETEGYDDVWPPPAPRSALRYTTATQNPQVIIQGNRRYVLHHSPPAQHTTASREEEEPRQHRRVHWSLIFGIGMVVMLALWIGGNMLLTWWTITQDDWHYGRPRTFQTDAVVGHADSPAQPSHFIAINFNRHVEIIELPGGDSSSRSGSHSSAGFAAARFAAISVQDLNRSAPQVFRDCSEVLGLHVSSSCAAAIPR